MKSQDSGPRSTLEGMLVGLRDEQVRRTAIHIGTSSVSTHAQHEGERDSASRFLEPLIERSMKAKGYTRQDCHCTTDDDSHWCNQAGLKICRCGHRRHHCQCPKSPLELIRPAKKDALIMNGNFALMPPKKRKRRPKKNLKLDEKFFRANGLESAAMEIVDERDRARGPNLFYAHHEPDAYFGEF